MLFAKYMLFVMLVQQVTANFVYHDKVQGLPKSPELPLGDTTREVSGLYEVVRTTTGVGRYANLKHSQVIIVFNGDYESMLAVDLHTVRSPADPKVRLDLGEINVLRIPYDEPTKSTLLNAGVVSRPARIVDLQAANPTYVPKSVYRVVTSQTDALVYNDERHVFSFLREWHRMFAHRYSMNQYDCQMLIASMFQYFSGLPYTCPDCDWHILPPQAELDELARRVQHRERALMSSQFLLPFGPNEPVDTLDELDEQCRFRYRAHQNAFPSPMGIQIATHEVVSNRTTERKAVFRALEISLHHIGSVFDFSPRPLVFRGKLSYAKRSFTAAENEVLYGEHVEPTPEMKLGPFKVALDIGGSLFRSALHLPNHQTTHTIADTGLELLKELNYGRRKMEGIKSRVRDDRNPILGSTSSGRQRFSFAVTDTKLLIATGGNLDHLDLPKPILKGTFKLSFDKLSKHNMHAGANNYLRYAGELVVVNLDKPLNDVEEWRAGDNYELVFDNGSGSFVPEFPALELEKLLACNFPTIPGKFRTRVIHTAFDANEKQADEYCEVFGGVDDILPAAACKADLEKQRPAVADTRHLCCADMTGGGMCAWEWADAEHCTMPVAGDCCTGQMVGESQTCAATPVCNALLAPKPGAFGRALHLLNAGVKKVFGGKEAECMARQWRTRMFDCISDHQPLPLLEATFGVNKALTILHNTFLADGKLDQELVDKWGTYFDALQKQGVDITLSHIERGPRSGSLSTEGDPLSAEAEAAVQCALPFFNHAFESVPRSIKLAQFLKTGVYDPSEGEQVGAKLRKLQLQYEQLISDVPDYKGEVYKNGFDGKDGCGRDLKLPPAADEWGNPVRVVNPETCKERNYAFTITREIWASSQFTSSTIFHTFELTCSGVFIQTAPDGIVRTDMVLAVNSVSTLDRSWMETIAMLENALITGPVDVQLRSSVDPGLCALTAV